MPNSKSYFIIEKKFFVLLDAKKVAVDLLLKASGFLEYCIHHILVHLPIHIRYAIPDIPDISSIYLSVFSFPVFFFLCYVLNVHLLIYTCRRNLPKDLQEGVLEAVSIQALGQVILCRGNCDQMSVLIHHDI